MTDKILTASAESSAIKKVTIYSNLSEDKNVEISSGITLLMYLMSN